MSSAGNHRIAVVGMGLAAATLLAGCSAGEHHAAAPGPSVSASTATPHDGPAHLANTRTYTEGDLDGILTTVNSALALDGSVSFSAGDSHEATTAMDSFLAGNKVSISPASCVGLVKADAQLAPALNIQKAISGTLTSRTLNASIATLGGMTLPSTLTSGFAAAQASQFAACKHLTILVTSDEKTVTESVDFARVAVATTATQSVGVTETMTAGSGGFGSAPFTTIAAVDGNLMIFVSGLGSTDVGPLEKTVDAIVAAAH